MIELEYKTITVHTDKDGEELCLRIEETEDSCSGILNLCWLDERQTQKLIDELIKGKERLKERKQKIDEILKRTSFPRLYDEFDRKYNPYPVYISPAEAFSKALADKLIDEDTYHAAHKYYGKIWFYVGD